MRLWEGGEWEMWLLHVDHDVMVVGDIRAECPALTGTRFRLIGTIKPNAEEVRSDRIVAPWRPHPGPSRADRLRPTGTSV